MSYEKELWKHLEKMSLARNKKLSLYNHYYSILSNEKICVYCGATGETEDHIPALDWIDCLGAAHFLEKGISLWIIWSCLECNLLLSTKNLFTIEERKAYLVTKYLRRYKEYLGGSSWTKEELEDVGPSLKRMLEEKVKTQEHILARMKVLREQKDPVK